MSVDICHKCDAYVDTDNAGEYIKDKLWCDRCLNDSEGNEDE